MNEFINGLISGLATILYTLISFLPASPFDFALNIDNEWIQAINWIVPIPAMITHMTLFLIAVLSYYLIRIPLKWIKLAGL